MIDISLTKSRDSVVKAFKLVYSHYLSKNYILENKAQMHIPVWSILPESYLITAKCNNKVCGVINCVVNGPCSLPFEKIAKKNTSVLKNNNSKICEISSLAFDSECIGNKSILELFRYAFYLAFHHLSCSDFIIGINPSHKNFYKRILLFDKIHESINYEFLQNAPVIYMHLNLKTAEEKFRLNYRKTSPKNDLYDFFFQSHRETLNKEIKSNLHEYKKLVTFDLLSNIIENSSHPIQHDSQIYDLFKSRWKTELHEQNRA
ncbi:hypothetical protein KAJ27_03585 [bacterium]|nr:hypothetical protein [bacterium]